MRPPEQISPALPLFRFRLRQLFWLVAVVSVLLAALTSTGGVASLAMLLAALVVSFHVFSTALGSQLRSHTDHIHGFRQPEASAYQPVQNLRPSPWYGRSDVALPWLRTLVVLAMLTGGALGAALISAAIGSRATLAGIVVGSISMAALAGWLAFIAGSFVAIVRGGFREAIAPDRK